MIFYLIEFYGRKADMDNFLGGESIGAYWITGARIWLLMVLMYIYVNVCCQ